MGARPSNHPAPTHRHEAVKHVMELDNKAAMNGAQLWHSSGKDGAPGVVSGKRQIEKVERYGAQARGQSAFSLRFLFSYHERMSLSRWGIEGVNTTYCGNREAFIY
jgi:hypothetical protein